MKSAPSIPNPSGHPARFSGAIVDKLRALLLADYPDDYDRPYVFDCNAGTGERLAELLGNDFDGGGCELQRKFIVNRKLVKQGDATNPKVYPNERFVNVLSPAYPNGVGDSYVIGADDKSYRPTYTAAHRALGGGDKLHPNNMGAYGYRGTKRGGRSEKRAAYWRLATAMVECWSANPMCVGIYLNVSDFLSGGEVEPLTADWRKLLRDYGWKIERTVKVRTPRNTGVEHADQRVEHESIIIARWPGRD